MEKKNLKVNICNNINQRLNLMKNEDNELTFHYFIAQEAIAEIAGIDRSSLYRFCNRDNENSLPDFVTFALLCLKLRMSPDDMIGDKEVKNWNEYKELYLLDELTEVLEDHADDDLFEYETYRKFISIKTSENVKKACKDQNVTISQLFEGIGRSRNTFYKLQKKQKTDKSYPAINITIFVEIAEYLKIDLLKLFDGILVTEVGDQND